MCLYHWNYHWFLFLSCFLLSTPATCNFGHPDKLPQVRNGETGDWIGSFTGHKGAVWSAKVDALTRTLAATASGDFSAKLWCATTGKELCEFKHKHVVKSVDFSRDSERIATGCQDGLMRIYQTNRPEQAATGTFISIHHPLPSPMSFHLLLQITYNPPFIFFIWRCRTLLSTEFRVAAAGSNETLTKVNWLPQQDNLLVVGQRAGKVSTPPSQYVPLITHHLNPPSTSTNTIDNTLSIHPIKPPTPSTHPLQPPPINPPTHPPYSPPPPYHQVQLWDTRTSSASRSVNLAKAGGDVLDIEINAAHGVLLAVVESRVVFLSLADLSIVREYQMPTPMHFKVRIANYAPHPNYLPLPS